MFLRNERSERRAGRQSHATAIEVASRHRARKAGTVIAERAAIPARQSGMSRPLRRVVWLEVGLPTAAHVLRNRRSREALTVGGIVLVALTHTSWKVLARIVRDLIAWDNARLATWRVRCAMTAKPEPASLPPADDGHVRSAAAGQVPQHDPVMPRIRG